MHAIRLAATFVAVIALADVSFAQTQPSSVETIASDTSNAIALPTTITIPAGTEVQVELTEALSSETSQQEQAFGLRLSDPIIIDGREIVAAGAVGGGEVIDVAPSSFGGRQGRLIISARFIEIDGRRVRIRGMHLSEVGDDRGNAALAASIAIGIPAFFIQGGEIHIPVGARATARLAADIDVPLTTISAGAEVAGATPAP